MKHILDSEFRYRPSFDTDVRKTFEKVVRAKIVDLLTACTRCLAATCMIYPESEAVGPVPHAEGFKLAFRVDTRR